MWINVLREFSPSREKRLETLSAHARIFRRVDRSSTLAYDPVEIFEQLQRLLAAKGKIQCESQSRTREGEHAGRLYIAKFFEYGQE